MKIIDKFGGTKKAYEILKQGGWNKKFHTFDMQVRRKRLSKQVILIFMGYALEKGVSYRVTDFWDGCDT